jgi:16S rRNA (uracil1498-N3)-methyltransferase
VQRVLRLHTGDEVVVFDGSGAEWVGVLDEVSGAALTARLRETRWPATEPSVGITVCQALIRAEPFEFALQKCTELGAARFVPMITARVQGSDATRPSPERLGRWRRIVQEAAEQSCRVKVPLVEAPVKFEEAVRSEAGHGPCLLLWEGPVKRSLRSVLQEIAADHTPDKLALFIGPAGGLEETEVAAAGRAGALVASMGPRVFKAETAAIAALTAVMFEYGQLGV